MNRRLRPSFGPLGLEMVDIFVGASKQPFRIHKDLLCERSPYFNRMFNNGLKETIDQSATLAEVDSDAFQAFVEWVYRSELNHGFHSQPAGLIKLYLFAEYICQENLRATALFVLQEALHWRPIKLEPEAIALVYNSTVIGSPLRKVLVEWLYHLVKNVKEESYPTFSVTALLVSNEEFTTEYFTFVRVCEERARDIIHIRYLAGLIVSFSLDLKSTVLMVKSRLSIHGVPWEIQELVFGSYHMENDRTLQSYGITNHDIIDLGIVIPRWWAAQTMNRSV